MTSKLILFFWCLFITTNFVAKFFSQPKSLNMFRKYLLFSSLVVALQSTTAKFPDPIDFLPPVDLPIDEESARLRRGANSSTDVS